MLRIVKAQQRAGKPLRRRPLLFLFGFALIGSAVVFLTQAAVSSISLEAEDGTRTNETVLLPDSTASSGGAVQFGSQKFSVVAAGDIGMAADRSRQAATADLVKRINPTYVIPLGDLAYPNGTSAEFMANYAPYWGVPEILTKTRPIPGNHEYYTTGATGYYNYFDPGNTSKFGARTQGWYSFVHNNWLFLNINSECSKVGGCQNGSAQANWVDQQLAANPGKCVVASWHRPRVTNGHHPDFTFINDIWNKIVARDGVVLSAHNHLYVRSVPLGNNATPAAGGITQFISGAGGAGFYTDVYSDPRDVKKIERQLGVLKLSFSQNTYSYQFIATNDQVLDQGSDTLNCNPS